MNPVRADDSNYFRATQATRLLPSVANSKSGKGVGELGLEVGRNFRMVSYDPAERGNTKEVCYRKPKGKRHIKLDHIS